MIVKKDFSEVVANEDFVDFLEREYNLPVNAMLTIRHAKTCYLQLRVHKGEV